MQKGSIMIREDEIKHWFSRHEKVLKSFDINRDGEISFHEKLWAVKIAIKWAQKLENSSNLENRCWYYYLDGCKQGPVSWKNIRRFRKSEKWLFVKLQKSPYWLPFRIIHLILRKGVPKKSSAKANYSQDNVTLTRKSKPIKRYHFKWSENDINNWLQRNEKLLKTFDVNSDGEISFHEKKWVASTAIRWVNTAKQLPSDVIWYYIKDEKRFGPVSWTSLKIRLATTSLAFVNLRKCHYWLPYALIFEIKKRGIKTKMKS